MSSTHPVVEQALASRTPCLFLSPHLDDAVLSCGGLLQTLAARCPVTVASIYTEAAPAPWTYAGRSFLRQCGVQCAPELYRLRRAEDVEVLTRLGVQPRHLGCVDALFRRRAHRSRWYQRLGRAVPELVHLYPSYRFDIARGRIARSDRITLPRLVDDVEQVIRELGAGVVFCPIGVGRNVDHLIVRTAGEQLAGPVMYYGEFPYLEHHGVDARFVARRGLTPWTWDTGLEEKKASIAGYHTQFRALFPDGQVPTAAERYWFAPGTGS